MIGMRTLRSQRPALALTALIALASIGCASTPRVPTPPPAVVYEDYRVGAPDLIQVKILPDPLIEDQVVVRPDGKITVQLIGDVQASGRTPDEIAKEIEKRVKRFKRGAKATVSVQTAASSTITVFGEVRRPGTFLLSKQTRVAEALGTSSGVTSFADLDSIHVVRGSGSEVEVIPVNLAAIRDGDLSTNIVVYGNDIIYVPPTTLAKIGYGFQALLFPLQPLLGVANGAAGSIAAGGL